MTPDEYEQAACRLGDAHLFDGYDSHRANDGLRVLAAVAICRGCPLRDRPINLTRHRSFVYRPRGCAA